MAEEIKTEVVVAEPVVEVTAPAVKDEIDWTKYGQDADIVKEIYNNPSKVHELLTKKRSGYSEAKGYRESLEALKGEVVDVSGFEEQIKELQEKVDLQAKTAQEQEAQLSESRTENSTLKTKQMLIKMGVVADRVDDAIDNWKSPVVPEGEDAKVFTEKYVDTFKERFSFYFNGDTATDTHNQSFTKPPKKDVKLEQAKSKGVSAVVSAVLKG